MLCAFTGHRPKRLPWGSKEEDPRCQALKVLMEKAVEQAVQRGCTSFVCGMAQGCDTWFAQIVLDMGYPLTAILPCAGQADRWSEEDRLRYEALLSRCNDVITLEDDYSEGCMLRRNHAMVDMADVLISVYDGCGGGTGSTVSYARRLGLEIIPVWL